MFPSTVSVKVEVGLEVEGLSWGSWTSSWDLSTAPKVLPETLLNPTSGGGHIWSHDCSLTLKEMCLPIWLKWTLPPPPPPAPPLNIHSWDSAKTGPAKMFLVWTYHFGKSKKSNFIITSSVTWKGRGFDKVKMCNFPPTSFAIYNPDVAASSSADLEH